MHRLRPRCARLEDEGGTTLIELLVAFSILAIIMSGVAATISQATDLTRDTRWREVAANTLTGEIERLRNQDPQSLTTGTTTKDVDTEYGPITITREATWVPAASTADACLAPDDEPRDLLRVNLEASWPGIDRPPTRTETVLTPTVGTFELGTGHLAVRLLDRDGEPVAPRPNVRVTGGPSGTSITLRATSSGCAFFDHLPPSDGSPYEVEVLAPGFIDYDGGEVFVELASVERSFTTIVEFTLDEPTTLAIGWETGATPRNEVTIPFDPMDIRITQALLADGAREFLNLAGPNPEIGGLFPFASANGGYDVKLFDEACGAIGEDVAILVATVPGELSPADFPVEVFRVRVVDADGDPVAGKTLTAVLEAGPCSGSAFTLGTTDAATGEVVAGLVEGTWRIDLAAGGEDAAQSAGPFTADADGVTEVTFNVDDVGPPPEPVTYRAIDTDGDDLPDTIGSAFLSCIGDSPSPVSSACERSGGTYQYCVTATDATPANGDACGQPLTCDGQYADPSDTDQLTNCGAGWPSADTSRVLCVGDGSPERCNEVAQPCMDTTPPDGSPDDCAGGQYFCMDINGDSLPQSCSSTFGLAFLCTDDDGADPPTIDSCTYDDGGSVAWDSDRQAATPAGAGVVRVRGKTPGLVDPVTYVAVDTDGDGDPDTFGQQLLDCIDNNGGAVSCEASGNYLFCYYFAFFNFFYRCDGTPNGGSHVCVDLNGDGYPEVCGTQFTGIDVSGDGNADAFASTFGESFTCTDRDDDGTIDDCDDGATWDPDVGAPDPGQGASGPNYG